MSEANVLQIVFSSKVAPQDPSAEPRSGGGYSADRDRLLSFAKKCGVSGLLLQLGTRYVGVIEGPNDVVLLFMERESTSGALHDLKVLRERTIVTRRFRELSQFVLPQGNSAEPLDEPGARFAARLSTELEVFDGLMMGRVGDGGPRW